MNDQPKPTERPWYKPKLTHAILIVGLYWVLWYLDSIDGWLQVIAEKE